MTPKMQIGAEIVDMTGEQIAALVGERTVTAREVQAEAQRRIVAQWPVTRQLNVLRAGDPAEIAAMGATIDAIRNASNAIEALTPIPADFAADGYWPD